MSKFSSPSNAEIYRVVTEVRENLKELHEKIDEIKPSLATHETRLNHHRSEINSIQDWTKKLTIGVLLAVIGMVLQFMLSKG